MPGIGRVLALVTEAPEGVGISGWRGCNRPGMVLSRVWEFGALRLLRIWERLMREGTDIREGFTLDWDLLKRIVYGVGWACPGFM